MKPQCYEIIVGDGDHHCQRERVVFYWISVSERGTKELGPDHVENPDGSHHPDMDKFGLLVLPQR